MTDLIALMRKTFNKHEYETILHSSQLRKKKTNLEKSQNEKKPNDFRIDFP